MKSLFALLMFLFAPFAIAQTESKTKAKPKTTQAKKPTYPKEKPEDKEPKEEMAKGKGKQNDGDTEAAKEKEKEKEDAQTDTTKKPDKIEIKPAKAPTATLKAEEIKDFGTAPENVKEALTYSLSLTEKNLTYTYGSCDPAAGGMDCSGTIYHVLQKHGWSNIPRQSDEMYRWTWEAGTFKSFNGNSMNTFELKQLRPGDLMFWTNTVGKSDRDPPVTHVMMYLGKKASDGKPVMFGASDGRTYDSVQRWGVSVFDFVLPREGTTARFIGYAHLPEKEAKTPESIVAEAKETPKLKPSVPLKKRIKKQE